MVTLSTVTRDWWVALDPTRSQVQVTLNEVPDEDVAEDGGNEAEDPLHRENLEQHRFGFLKHLAADAFSRNLGRRWRPRPRQRRLRPEPSNTDML